jgi:hypothetical protein
MLRWRNLLVLPWCTLVTAGKEACMVNSRTVDAGGNIITKGLYSAVCHEIGNSVTDVSVSWQVHSSNLIIDVFFSKSYMQNDLRIFWSNMSSILPVQEDRRTAVVSFDSPARVGHHDILVVGRW